jgi:hypothetical protein
MRTALLLLLAFAAPALAGSTVWKWKDDKGVTHYSDQPVPGATKVEVIVGSTWNSSGSGDDSSSSPEPEPGAAADSIYRNFEIWRPEPNQVFVNNGGEVTVEIRVEPGLQPDHALNLYLDGKLVEGQPHNATSYPLTGLARGGHSVIATVTDARGNRLQETPPVVFTVRQESIANPPTGPSLRPPPKPRPGGTANKLPSTQPTYGALNGARPAINPATNMPVAKKPAPKPLKP